jgi:hypothetical protein
VIERVQDILERRNVPYALIGGMAVAARGHTRFTADFDVLTTDRRVFEPGLWTELRDAGIPVDIRQGDLDDPLAGVVRIGSKPHEVDIVVGRSRWEGQIVQRAERLTIGNRPTPVALTGDLILLKLAAGGPIDQQDIMALLALGPRDDLIREVNDKISELPRDSAGLWTRIVAEAGG